MPSTASVSGLVSGIQTDEIVSKIISIAKRPQQLMEIKKAKAQYALAAWQDINTRALALQTKSYTIASTSSFLAKTATSSDETIAIATANTNAIPGTYTLKVDSKAQNHQLASQTFVSMQENIGTGSLSISFANGESFDIEIDKNNNTLLGLKDAINRAGKGVSAAIINQGTEAEPQYRLMLSSDKTGTDNAMTVNTTGLSINIDQEIQAAKNAQITLGTGANAITVSRSSNTISEVIPGVSINILSASPNNPITISVGQSTEKVKESVQDFVSQFNDLMKAINDQSKYDAEINDTPALFGNFQLQNMQNDLTSMITRQVEGLTGKFVSLSSVGITLGNNGLLVVDESKLTAALDENQAAVARLFGASLDSDNSSVSFAASTNETKSSGLKGWELEITQAARRAQLTAGQQMSSPLLENETMVIGGIEVKLTAGMDIEQVIAAINAKSSETNVTALRTGADGTGTGNYITLRSNSYGSKHTFNVSSNVSQAQSGSTGFGNVLVSPDNAAGESGNGLGLLGLDVEGTINGETCTGNGQILTADPTSAISPIRGLSVLVAATDPMDTQIRFTKGIGATMQEFLTKLTSKSGTFSTAQDTLNSEIDAIDKDIKLFDEKLSAQESRLYAQYAAMESKLAALQNQSSSISALFASFNANKNNT